MSPLLIVNVMKLLRSNNDKFPYESKIEETKYNSRIISRAIMVVLVLGMYDS